MEKLLWTAIVLLWLGMLSTAALADEGIQSLPLDTDASTDPGIPAVSTAVATVSPALAVNAVSVTPAPALLSTSKALSPELPARDIALNITRRPVLQLGQHGGADVAGAFVVGGFALWCARRRRIV